MVSEFETKTPKKTERPRVLVVDDEYGPRESIAFTLGKEFEVEKSERALDALERVKRTRFAVIILDIRMPEMDGIAALSKIREIDPEVAIVMLTGYGTLHTAQQAMMGGANQYLRKPPDIDELVEAVRQQAHGTAERREQAQANSEVKKMNAALKCEMEAVQPAIWQGRASVELVHDLANPLTVLIGYAGLLGELVRSMADVDPARGQKMTEYSRIIERASEYCHHLSDNWRQATRKAIEFGEVDLVALVEEVRQMIFFDSPAIKASGLERAPVRGARFELARIFQNLFRNSLEAEATTVEVKFARRGESYEVAVIDDGCGMDEDTAKSALSGGFTTKAHGTGLGLSICRHLLGAHGASMDVESEPKAGTTVRLLFPGLK